MYTNVRTASRLVITNPTTGEEIELLERRTAAHGPTFSPTGDRIAFFQETDKGVHLFTRPHRWQRVAANHGQGRRDECLPTVVCRWIVPVLLSGQAHGFVEEDAGRRRRRD